MKKKDKGSVQKVLVLFLLTWLVCGFGILMTLAKAGYVSRYIEDCLMQANLAAILIDPYHYGATAELVFENVEETKTVFFEFTFKNNSESLGDAIGTLPFEFVENTNIDVEKSLEDAKRAVMSAI